MKDLLWRSALTVAALMALALLGPGRGRDLGRRAAGQAPEAQVLAYLQAVARGDRQAALDHLRLPTQAGMAAASRCRAITDELLAHGADLQYRVVEVEWRPAASPAALADDGARAGIARVRVAIDRPGIAERIILFDVLASGGLAGEAGGAVRGWAIVDVRRQDEGPLARTGKE
jgi:hypothetical protein